MAAATPPRLCPGLHHLCVPSFFPSYGSPRYSTVLGCGVSRAGVFVWLGLGYMPGWSQELLSTLSTLSRGLDSTLALLMDRVQASHHPPISPNGPLTHQGSLSLLCRNPGLGHPIYGSHYSLPRVALCLCIIPFPLSLVPGSQILT